jgi:hypothetical protein
VVFFFLDTPALANALLLRKRGPVIRRWYLAGALCTAFAFCLVLGGCLEDADKVELIRGTSDVVYGDEHMALIQAATKYAARYNALIARHRGLTTAGGGRGSGRPAGDIPGGARVLASWV